MPQKTNLTGSNTLLQSFINQLSNHHHLQDSYVLYGLIHLSSSLDLKMSLKLRSEYNKLLKHFFSCWLDTMERHNRLVLKIHKQHGLKF